MLSGLLFSLLTSLVTGSAGRDNQPVVHRQSDLAEPTVTIDLGGNQSATLLGTATGGVHSYHGVPYAAAPVGDLRFQPPQDFTWTASTWNASLPGPACIQAEDDMYTTKYGMDEDCLFLSIQVPSVLPDEPVPVMFWVYGGSWQAGATSYYDGSWLVSQAAETDRPVIYVAVNYRLGYLGFPFGAEAHEQGASNLGLRDVIKALEWTRDHIAAFGGDPHRVTVYGESAGAISIALLYLQPDLDLFASAIMQSGSLSTAPMGASGEMWLDAYDLLLELSGCQEGGNQTSSGFECLGKLPATDLLAAQSAVKADSRFQLPLMFAPSIDGDLIPSSPHQLLADGAFARQPFINGVMRDEGTLFVPAPPAANVADMISVYSTLLPTPIDPNILQELFDTVYPDVPALGSPFGSGNETFGNPSTNKQFAAAFGDGTFQASRRWLFEQAYTHNFTQTWTYQMDVKIPTYPAAIGAAHSIDLSYSFGDAQLALSDSTSERANWARSFNFTGSDAALSRTVIDYWLNFAHYADPNGDDGLEGSVALPLWPAYGEEKNLLEMTLDKLEVVPDTFRAEQIQWFLDQPEVWSY